MTTIYSYDELGSLTNQVDANGHATQFYYDALGHRTKRILPGGQSEGIAYDVSGNAVYQTNFNGVIITNLYDVDNRLTNCSSLGYRTTYAYSATGLRTNMVDASGTNSYVYNPLNQLTNKTVAWATGPKVSLNYLYDALGSVTNIWSSTANGVNLAYTYDPLGRITNVLANGTEAAGYGYDAVGNLQAMYYGNSVTNLYQYDSRNRLTNELWKSGNTSLASFAYTLGAVGNRTALSETVNGTSRTYNWAYDYLYRLTSEGIGSVGTVTYGFDSVGNRISRQSTVSQISTTTASYNANDWLTSDTYDTNGNTTVSGTTNYQYDVLNHLTNANIGGIIIIYDGDGNRVSKKVGTTTTYYLVDEVNPSGYTQVLEEWTSTGTPALSRVYNYGSALISQRQASSGTVSYYGADGHGNTRFLANTSGGITDTYAFDAYGLLVASTGSTPNSYLYCGQQYDSDLGFYYLRARYYKPDSGRFWTMDTYTGNNGDPLSLHKYLYCQDSPVDNYDDTGNATHHIVPQSLWKGFSADATAFFDSSEATIEAAAHDYSGHGAYNCIADERITEFLAKRGWTKGSLSATQAKQLLKDLQDDPFIKGFNSMVKEGPQEIQKWIYETGANLLPEELRGRALKRAAAAGLKHGWLASVAKKGTGPFLQVGFAILTAERMQAQGYSSHDITKAIVDDFYLGIPGMAEQASNEIWDDANGIATQVRNGAFSYLDYDSDDSKYDGSNGLLVSEQAVDAIIKRQNLGGQTITAGSLTGGF